MQWNERLALERKRLGLLQEQVVTAMAQYLPNGERIGKGALSSWESGRTQPKIQHALALARVLDNADVNYLFGSDMLRDGLNDAGLQKLSEFRSILLDSPRYRAEIATKHSRILPVFLQAASAGTGQILDDEAFEEVVVDEEVPFNADFGVRLAGDSMMPLFSDGQLVWVKRRETAENGEIVMCYYDGQSYCKKLRSDGTKTELVSLNPAYKPMPITAETEFRIFGVVISAAKNAQ